MELTITQVLDDLRTADEIVRRFERRYWLSSADFYALYQQGLLDDGARTEDYALWAGFHQINLDREAALSTLSGQRVRQLRGQTLALDPREPSLRTHNTTGFLARADYEAVVAALPKAFPAITKSNLRVRNAGAPTAIIDGELHFPSNLRLRVIEAIDFKASRIQAYAYTLWQGDAKLGWFDSTPLSQEPHLAENFPHHYHDLSSGEEQRAAAPALSFTSPNLPAVINFCLQVIQPVPPSVPALGKPHPATAPLPGTAPINLAPANNGHTAPPTGQDDVIVALDNPRPLPPDNDPLA
jgi:hypothetical protein